MGLRKMDETSRNGDRRMDRRRFLTLATGALAIGALAPALAACGDDDDGDGDDDAVEAADDGDSAVAESDDNDDGTFPDDFPDNIPLPDDWEMTSNLSREREGSREINLRFESHGNRMAMIEAYDTDLPTHYEVTSQQIDEEAEEATWIINDGDWEWGSVVLADPREDDDADFEVHIQLHEEMR
jgi:hypothetical protein